MKEQTEMLERLEALLKWKESKAFYAKKLNVSVDVINSLMKKLKLKKLQTDDEELEELLIKQDRLIKSENLKTKTSEISFNSPNEIKSLEELIEKCNIDVSIWEVSKYVQNYWGNKTNPHWQVKAWLNRRTDKQEFTDKFLEFLKNYIPSAKPSHYFPIKNPPACLVLNKQDSHLDKLDIDGDNDLLLRFNNLQNKIRIILEQSSLSNRLEVITYILGSDEFNSEFTKTTTKGTPQTNVTDYHDSFEKICNHEVSVINMLLQKGETVEIVFVPGNHDEYVGWHLVNWLSTYYRHDKRITFENSPKYRKYVSYGSSAMLFNHGDAIKPEKLASIFPIEFKDNWSNHSNFYIFTGDKHHEVSKDFNGIKFYQIPALSNSKSKWDDKLGYVGAKGEVTGFLIDREKGITNILKQQL